MIVKELIEILQELPQDGAVEFYADYDRTASLVIYPGKYEQAVKIGLILGLVPDSEIIARITG